MKCLIVKTSSLGDVVQTFPVLQYLREQFPKGQIDWVVEAPFAPLVRAHPDISTVLKVDSKKYRKNIFSNGREMLSSIREIQNSYYDVIFDLQGNCKSGLITFLAKGKEKIGFGWKTVSEWPNWLVTGRHINPPPGHNVREDYLFIVKRFFGDHQNYSIKSVLLNLTEKEALTLNQLGLAPRSVMVAPGSAWTNKRLKNEDLIACLRKVKKELNPTFYFTSGTKQEKEFCLALADGFGGEVLDSLSLPLLQNIMARMDLVIAMDSLPLHLCATTEAPTLSFFGPSLAVKYAPIGSLHRFIQGSCPYGIQFDKRCPRLRTCSTGDCMKNLGEQVEPEVFSNPQAKFRRSL